MVVLVIGTVGLTSVVIVVQGVVVSTGEVHGWSEEDDAHLVPGHREFDEENNKANPYLPLPDDSDRLSDGIFCGVLSSLVLCFVLQHCNERSFF